MPLADLPFVVVAVEPKLEVISLHNQLTNHRNDVDQTVPKFQDSTNVGSFILATKLMLRY